jgi:hypothetical protein
MNVELPTVDEYRKHQWFAMSSVIDPAMKDSYFTVWAETYPAVFVPHNTALFRHLYAVISHPGQLGGANSTKIGLLDGDLVDQAKAAAVSESQNHQ